MNYQIVHSIAGRLRIRIARLAWDEDFANRLSALIDAIAAVTSVRVNAAASSLVVTYQTRGTVCEQVQQEVFACIGRSQLADYPASHSPLDVPPEDAELEPEVNHWQDLSMPALSMTVALLAAPLELPALVVGGAIAGAAMPWVARAADSLLTQRQPNIDLLDSLWMGMQTLQGQYAAPALKTCLVEIRRALRGTTAEQRQQHAQTILNEFDQPRWIECNGQRQFLAATEIAPGDQITVKRGDRIPVDGWILEGTALVSEENLTGDTCSVVCTEGQLVYASTLVLEGELCIVAQQVGANTRMGIVAQVMQSAPVHDTQLGVQQATFVRQAVFPTILFGGAMFAMTGNFGAAVSPFQFDFGSGIPISVHTTLLSALTYSARHGIYIRSARTLELLSQLDAIVFDRSGLLDATGTLRRESQATIAQLQAQGISIYWVTPTQPQAINIPPHHACVAESSDQIATLIAGLQHHGKTVAFVGSDEQAAIQADVAIAFANQPNGSDVVLMHEELRGLIEAIAVANRAIQLVYENTAIIVLPNLLIQIGGGMILGINPVINVITNNSSALVAEFVHGARPLFDQHTPPPIARRSRKLSETTRRSASADISSRSHNLDSSCAPGVKSLG